MCFPFCHLITCNPRDPSPNPNLLASDGTLILQKEKKEKIKEYNSRRGRIRAASASKTQSTGGVRTDKGPPRNKLRKPTTRKKERKNTATNPATTTVLPHCGQLPFAYCESGVFPAGSVPACRSEIAVLARSGNCPEQGRASAADRPNRVTGPTCKIRYHICSNTHKLERRIRQFQRKDVDCWRHWHALRNEDQRSMMCFIIY